MKKQSNYLSQNLMLLRQRRKYSQEEVAEYIGVSRQAVAKWENGESMPDIVNCDALAKLYDVSVDDLIHFNQRSENIPLPPRGKHIFGTVKVGDRGQIVLPKTARDIFHIKPGDLLVVLGNESPESPEAAGIALISGDTFLKTMDFMRNALKNSDDISEPERSDENDSTSSDR